MKRATTGGLIASLSIAVLGAVAPASAAQAAEPGALSVTVVTANGSGCPSATATAGAVDSDTFTVNSTSYYAWSGDGAPATDIRKNCQLALQVSQPEGWTYAVSGADFSGYAQLDEGITGTVAAHYYFQGESDTASTTHTLAGPYTGGWTASDSLASDELVFAPCDGQRNLNINTEVRVTSATEGLNWVYEDPTFTVHLTWQACS